MGTKNFRILLAIVGFLGIIMLSASFAINPGPPAGLSNAQLIIWGKQNEILVQAGAWMQIVGSFLEVVLVLGILHITATLRSFLGVLVAVSFVLIMGVSLVESSFYLAAIASGVSGDLEGLHIMLNLITSIQHAYTIILAPCADAGLGVILLTSALFSGTAGRILGYAGIAFGSVLLILGFINTFVPFQEAVNNVLTVQQVWLIAIAVVVALSTRRTEDSAVADQPDVARAL